MTEKSMKMPEFLREPLEAAQARLVEFEEEAQKVFKELMQKGKESRKDVAVLVQRLSRQDWRMDELRDRVTKLRAQGMERANELKDRAETFRADAMEKLEDLQTKAVAFLGVATREQVEELSRELEKLARRIDKDSRGRKAKKGNRRSAAEV
jgi:polyhydroxyalkanoate synthesis regulator phasin